MSGETQLHSYLVIQDLLGARQIHLTHAHYLVGGSAECDIQLISPTAHECWTLFTRRGDRYQVSNIDLQRNNGEQVVNCEYKLQHCDRIIYAPDAIAVYYISEEPPELMGIGAKLPVAPSFFPSAEAEEPIARRCDHLQSH